MKLINDSFIPYLNDPTKNGWYGHSLPFPDCEFCATYDDPVVLSTVEIIKKMIFEAIRKKPIKIINEQIVIRPPFRDLFEEPPTIRPGIIGWKAQFIFEEN